MNKRVFFPMTVVLALGILALACVAHALTPGGGSTRCARLDLLSALGFLIPLALTDSVNPCTFVLYATLLISTSASGSRGRVATAGLAFIAAVITGYFLLGVGLSEATSFLPPWLVFAVAIAYATYIILRSIRGLRGGGREVCREGDEECRAGRLAAFFGRNAGVLAAYGIGLLASFTLLPCSAGPYIAFAMMISTQSLTTRLLLLIIYNLVFVAPLIAILAAMLGITRLSAIKDKLVRYQAQVSLASGVLMLAVAAFFGAQVVAGW